MVMEHSLPPVLQSLLRPAAYPHAVDHIDLMETHISWVFLTGEFAYKVKKPVNLGFLDFSTLERRRFYCNEELRLNRRFAPDIYLSVASINSLENQSVINGNGEILEYAVVMRQFPAHCRLDIYLEQHPLEPDYFTEFARRLAAFHEAFAYATGDDDYGTCNVIEAAASENFTQIQQLLGNNTPALLATLETWTREQGRQLRALFNERKQNAHVRECHGDMHLANMLLLHDRITLFDGIDFNDKLRWIDVISDIAFLIMDLQDRGFHRHANTFLNAYLTYSGDFNGLPLLPYYKTYRAMVRAKVTLLQALPLSRQSPARQHMQDEFNAYLQLAGGYIRQGRPRLLLTVGYSGSGKSTVAAQLAWRLDAIHIRSDVERKRLAGLDAHAASGSAVDGGLYDQQSTIATYQRLYEISQQLLTWGYTVIVDASFLNDALRHDFLKLAIEHRAGFTLLHITASPAKLRDRVVKRTHMAGQISEADITVLEQQLRKENIWRDGEQTHVVEVETDETIDYDQLLKQIDQAPR